MFENRWEYSYLDSRAWNNLGQFVESGGTIIALGSMPENSENSFPDTAVQKQFKALFQAHEAAIFVKEWTPRVLDRILMEQLSKAIRLDDETIPLRMAHRRIKGREIFYIINDSEEYISTEITLQVQGKLEELEPYHGKIYRSGRRFK